MSVIRTSPPLLYFDNKRDEKCYDYHHVVTKLQQMIICSYISHVTTEYRLLLQRDDNLATSRPVYHQCIKESHLYNTLFRYALNSPSTNSTPQFPAPCVSDTIESVPLNEVSDTIVNITSEAIFVRLSLVTTKH